VSGTPSFAGAVICSACRPTGLAVIGSADGIAERYKADAIGP
jgi:hypothetical protein